MENESLFLSYVRWTFKRWVGLQAAIEEGMGGPFAKEKELWMGTEIEKYFNQYADSSPSDIEEYLGEMIENEFNTYFEDGSLKEVSQRFCNAYELSKVNPLAPIFQEMSTKQSTHQSSQNSLKTVEISDEIEGSESVVKDMEALKLNNIDEDGWTTVTRKSKKK